MTKGKLEILDDGVLGFWCPGCEQYHMFFTDKAKNYKIHWDFNGNYDKPTFSPSLLNTKPNSDYRCHLFLRDGMIQYLSDCNHRLAGQTVELKLEEETESDIN